MAIKRTRVRRYGGGWKIVVEVDGELFEEVPKNPNPRGNTRNTDDMNYIPLNPESEPIGEPVIEPTKYQLKDGTSTSDRRLDRLVYFDERSRSFPVKAVVGDKPIRSYTWRCNQTLDQGPDGACVGFGVAHELIARPAEVEGITDKYAKEQIYWEAQMIDWWNGGSYPGASPVYEGTSVLAGCKVAKNLGWIEEYRWAFGLRDLQLGVGHNGPALIGVPWYEGMFNPDENGYIHVTGEIAGGHCVLVNSINIKEERFTIHNSWGAGWGNNGECYISFDDMGKLLDNYGEAAFFLERHNKAQPDD